MTRALPLLSADGTAAVRALFQRHQLQNFLYMMNQHHLQILY